MTTVKLKRAFARYVQGDRPWRLVQKDWFVVGPDKTLFPAKYIWALATNQSPSNFNTSDARRELANREYSVIRKDDFIGCDSVDFEHQVRESQKLSDSQLKKRLERALRTPTVRLTTIKVFNRNPDVVAYVRNRAAGKCESCGNPAPFLVGGNGAPFLEVHHRVQLSEAGEDTVDNAIAVCPNCHRRAHYG